jgi:hypothetical protein
MVGNEVTVTVTISYRGTVAEHSQSRTSGNPIFAVQEAEGALAEVSQTALSMIAAAHGRPPEKARP